MRRLAVAVGAVAVLMVGGVTFAQATGDDPIYACVNNGDGSVRVVASADTPCPKNFSPLQWSQQGPQGLPGEPGQQGERGEQGEQGVPGEPGSSGVNITLVKRTVAVPAAVQTPIYHEVCTDRNLFGQCTNWSTVFDGYNTVPGTVSATATCPDNMQIMSDGDASGASASQGRVGYTGWRANFTNNDPFSKTGHVEVRCVEVAEVTTVAL
jgi:hypothetical protein